MIRPLQKEDLSLLLKIELDDQGVTHGNSQLSDEAFKKLEEKIVSFIDSTERGGFIFEEEDQSLGFIMYSIENCEKKYDWPTPYQSISRHHFSDDGQIIAVYQLWVKPSQRRRNIATRLKKHLETYARAQEIDTLYTHTDIINQHVIDLNMALDYKVVRIGPIWDDILRISMIKNLKQETIDTMLSSVKDGKTCLVSAEDLDEHFEDTSLQLLDIRQDEDFEEYHLKNSIHSYWSNIDLLLQENLLDQNKTTIVICYTGQSSMHIATLLNLKGYKAYSLLDGLNNWPYENRIERE